MFNSVLSNGITIEGFMLCLLTAVICGLMIATTYKMKSYISKSFVISLILLPAITACVIMMVNGNLGVGVAVAGSFQLVRFRSMPGKASDIVMIFMAMAAGLACGVGFILFALIVVLLLCLVYRMGDIFSDKLTKTAYRNIRLTIPEDLDYHILFEDTFNKYTDRHEIEFVKTINLGTMYQISYDCVLKDGSKEKEFLDSLRIMNGNLPVISSATKTVETEL